MVRESEQSARDDVAEAVKNSGIVETECAVCGRDITVDEFTYNEVDDENITCGRKKCKEQT